VLGVQPNPKVFDGLNVLLDDARKMAPCVEVGEVEFDPSTEDVGTWQFFGSEGAGSRAAVLFTILPGPKRHNLEPWAYLREVLLRLSAGEAELESLLPDRCAASPIPGSRAQSSSPRANRVPFS
jgi:hypothetical protein